MKATESSKKPSSNTTRERRTPEPSALAPPVRTTNHSCYLCGRRAGWRIEIAGEDERRTPEYACDGHAEGHIRVARLAESEA